MRRDLYRPFRYQRGPHKGKAISCGDIVSVRHTRRDRQESVVLAWKRRSVRLAPFLMDGKVYVCGMPERLVFIRSQPYHCRTCGYECAPLDDGTKEGCDPGLEICENCDEEFGHDGKNGTTCVHCGEGHYNYHCPECGEFGGWGLMEWCPACSAVVWDCRRCNECGKEFRRR